MFKIQSLGRQRADGPSAQSRQISADWSLRALIVAAVLTDLVVVPLLVAYSRSSPAAAPTQQGSRQFSPSLSPKELQVAVKASVGAYAMYIKYDRVQPALAGIEAQFASITSEGELLQLFDHLRQKSGDDWFRVLTEAEFHDMVARRGGADIGVDIAISFSPTDNCWKVDKAGSLVEQAGINVGDLVTAVGGADLPIDQPSRQTVDQFLKQFLKSGKLRDTTAVIVKRKEQLLRFSLTFGVLSRKPGFTIADFRNPVEGVSQPDLKEITFNHLEGATLLSDLFQELQMMQRAGVRGLIVDLRQLSAGDPEKAAQVAAMFLERGVLSHSIETTGDGMVMKDYAIESDGKVHRKTWGPYAVEPNGAIDPAISGRDAAKPDREEVLDWPTNVVRAPIIIAITGRKTAGAGELIACAFAHNWESGDKRAKTVAKFRSTGNGLGRTYFPVGPYWLRIATSVHLQPDGNQIDELTRTGAVLGPNPNVAIAQSVSDELDFAREEMLERLNDVEAPDRLPAVK